MMNNKSKFFSFYMSSMIALIFSVPSFAVTKITRIEYEGKKSPHVLTILGDGPLQISKTENNEDHQIVLEIDDAKFLTKNVSRRLDASSFPGNISLISPYALEGKNAVRIIIQLRRNGVSSSELTTVDKKATITLVSNKFVSKSPSTSSSQNAQKNTEDTVSGTQSDTEVTGDAAPQTDNGVMKLEEVEDSLKKKSYMGKRITVNFKDADVVDVFKLIGETSGFNLVIGSDVTGKLTLSLTDVPWDQVLDLVLTTLRLGAERNGNILRIATLSTLTQEKDQLIRARNATNLSAPRVTRIFPISYAKPADLVALLTKFGAGAAGTNDGSSKDTIVVDERTNSLVIQDIQDNINRMAKLIELMDQPTPQVQIEAKVIEASEDFSKSLSGDLGFGAQNKWPSAYGYGATKGGNIGGSLVAGTPLSTASLTSPAAAGSAASIGMGLNIAKLFNTRLNALLSFQEGESKSRTISSPRLVVLNKQKANIVQGQPVLVPVTTTNPVNGSSQITNAVQQAVLSLDVTPTVTNDGNILMDISVSSNIPKSVGAADSGLSGIATRTVKTLVVTESGGTMVIGGVYGNTENSTEGGIPFLRKLPLIGSLFGSSSNNSSRSELFVFISPRVLNEMDSVGATQSSSVNKNNSSTLVTPSTKTPEKLSPEPTGLTSEASPNSSLSLDAPPSLDAAPTETPMDLPAPPSGGGDSL